MKQLRVFLLALAALLPWVAQADYRREPPRSGHNDTRHWRSGQWRHGWHDGRLGWWWVAGGLWYLHRQPVYPYPEPPPSVVVIEPEPPVYVAPVAPMVPAVPAEPTPAPFWYYCEANRMYYPYVASCPSGWKTVPATPPGVQKP